MNNELLGSETGVKCFTDFTHLRYVRQAEWSMPYMPGPRILKDAEILGYAYTNGGKPTRIFYVMATTTDGLELFPDEADPHGGVPCVPSTISARTPPMPYSYLPDAVAERERSRRSAHVAYWELQRKLNAPKSANEKPRRRRWWLLWLW